MKIDAELKERIQETCRRMPPIEKARFKEMAWQAYLKAVQARGLRKGEPQGAFAEGLALAGAILHGDPDGLLEEDDPIEQDTGSP